MTGRLTSTFALALLCVTLPASAQDGLLIGGRYISASRAFGQVLGPGPLLGQDQLFGGGRYALIAGTVFDGRSGQPVYATPDFVLALDLARPRLFERRSDGVWVVHVATRLAHNVLPAAGASVQRCAFAYSADVLYCAVDRADGLSNVVAADLATAAVRTLTSLDLSYPAFWGPIQTWLATPDGRRLYFGERSTSLVLTLASLEVATGLVTHSAAPGASGSYGFTNGRVSWDDANQRVIAQAFATVWVLGSDLSVILAETAIGGECNDIQVSPHTGRVYIYEWVDYFLGGYETLRVFDSTTFAPLASPVVRLSFRGAGCRTMAVITAPGVPRDTAASVNGRDVSLSWTNVGGASHFVLDVGLAPGRTDASVFLGPDSHATFGNVPPGTYYLRLRGGNEFGGGRPSQEIQVVVP